MYYVLYCYRNVPLFRETVKVIDPYTYMSDALNDLTRQMGSLLDLVETRSLRFLNSMYELADTTDAPPNTDFEVSVEKETCCSSLLYCHA